MSIRNTLSLFVAVLIGYAISPSYSGDIISCDSYENCPDGSVPLTNALLALEAKIDALEALLAGVSRFDDSNGYDTLRFSGMNVQVVNGTGTTFGTPDGMGNLIIGYSATRGNTDCPDGFSCDRRTGSHNLIIGDSHNYTSYGGLVAGFRNEVSAEHSSVSGGINNVASANWSSVSGGNKNKASGNFSSVSGGDDNEASGRLTWIAGGEHNQASANWSSLSGGEFNEASGEYSSVSGGKFNEASGKYSSISGGENNGASGDYSSISGGNLHLASGKHSSISGAAGRIAVADFCWEGDNTENC